MTRERVCSHAHVSQVFEILPSRTGGHQSYRSIIYIAGIPRGFPLCSMFRRL